MPTDELVLLTAGIFSCPRFLAVDHAGTYHADNNAYAADDRNPHGRVAERQSDEQTDHNARKQQAGERAQIGDEDQNARHHADGKVRKFLVGAVLRAFKLCWHSSMVPAYPAPQERIFASRLETYTGRVPDRPSDARPV